MTFDADRTGRLALGLEGGHSARRIVHAGGAATGRRIIRQLSALAAEEERIAVLEGRRATQILTADGRAVAVALDDGTVIAARAIVLATGGAAALWQRTTNPPGAIGAGLLLAHAAGAQLADLELMQFHPTVVSGGNGSRHRDGFLVTEAVRGEGARLLDAAGERFVNELAPRDEVARAVQRQIDSSGGAPVGLDMREVDPALFPNVVSALREAGIDPERELVPVAPAAHYMMGGVATDLNGRASLAGALRRRRVLLHRAARRQPPGLQLAERVLRVRRPRRPRRARGAGDDRQRPRRSTRPPAPPPRSPSLRSRAPRCGAMPAWSATARGCCASPRTPTRWCGSSPPGRWPARRAEGPTSASISRIDRRFSTAAMSPSRQALRPTLETWS